MSYFDEISESNFSRPQKKVFIHKDGLKCGHHHVYESKKIKEVDCYACIEILRKTIHNYDEVVQDLLPNIFDVKGRYEYQRRPVVYIGRDSVHYKFDIVNGAHLHIDAQHTDLIWRK